MSNTVPKSTKRDGVRFDPDIPSPSPSSPPAPPPSKTTPSSSAHSSRRVSFSNVLITDCDDVVVDNEEVPPTAHHLAAQEIDPSDDLFIGTPLADLEASSTVRIHLVRLGMLKQATVYQANFALPDPFSAASPLLDLQRYKVDQLPKLGASVRLIECCPSDSLKGHDLVLEISTLKAHRLFEVFTIRPVNSSDPNEYQVLALSGLSLARGQGTPCLRFGLHRQGPNPEFTDSDDEQTDWPGFDEDDQEDDGVELDDTDPDDGPKPMSTTDGGDGAD